MVRRPFIRRGPARPRVAHLIAATLIATTALTAGTLAAPPAHADSTSDERARVQKYLDALDNLDNQMGQTNEDTLAAQGKLTQLQSDIAVLQRQVSTQSGELGKLQQLLTNIAIDRFTASGSAAQNPLLTDSSAFAEAQQRDALARVAMNAGIADADDAQNVVDQLTDRQRRLARKKREAAALVATLNAKTSRLTALQSQYQALEADAKKDLKQAIIDQEIARRKAEAERRAAIALAKARKAEALRQARAAAAAKAAAAARRRAAQHPAGGGRGGGGSGGGTKTPEPPPIKNYPGTSGRAGIAVSAALSQQGTPYHFGMSSPGRGFDCSGLTSYAWARAGVYLPHQSAQQYAVTPHVPESAASPGDLIFFHSPISHVGLYIGGGQMVHAPRTGDVVRVVGVDWDRAVGVSRPG